MVVDSNYLERQELRDYLFASKSNLAILTDYAAMEAYKSDTLNSIHRRMSLVCEFPTQIIVLIGTQEACSLTGSTTEIANRLVDRGQTKEFPTFCRALALARSGSKTVQRQLIERGREAHAHLERVLSNSEQLAAGIEEIAASYTYLELKAIRRHGVPYPAAVLEKTSHRIMELASQLMRDHPAVTSFPSASEAPDRFLFRVALCGIILAVQWISVGGARLAKPEKLRNDQVDINFAAFATYYDGLLTADARLASICAEAKFWLGEVFSRPNEGSQ